MWTNIVCIWLLFYVVFFSLVSLSLRVMNFCIWEIRKKREWNSVCISQCFDLISKGNFKKFFHKLLSLRITLRSWYTKNTCLFDNQHYTSMNETEFGELLKSVLILSHVNLKYSYGRKALLKAISIWPKKMLNTLHQKLR